VRKVFISTTSFAKDDIRPMELLKEAGLEVYTNPHDRKLLEDEMIKYLSDIDFLIAGTEPLTQQVLESAKKLKIISRCGVGMDNIDMKAAAQLGIKVYNTPYGPTLSVAELTVGLVLDLLRRVTMMDRDIRSGIWEKRMGNLLNSKKVGIIGFGNIGQKVAELLTPFGCKIKYYDIRTKNLGGKAERLELDELLKITDIISIHISSKEQMIGEKEIKLMKKGAWLINTSRGGVVDENALYQALKDGHLSGAALDVFEQEPYMGPLKELENAILTPHIGSYAKEGRIEMEMQAVKNLLDGIKGL
jgi:D-3-phosphoglycerate dehydrogenase